MATSLGLGNGLVFGGVTSFFQSLFAGGYKGVYFDASDLTTIYTDRDGYTPATMPGLGSAITMGVWVDKSAGLAWSNGSRRLNRLTYSEQFDDAAWAKTRSSISANATTDPLGGNTADKLVESSDASSTHFVNNAAGTAGVSEKFSFYAKAGERTWCAYQMGTASSAYFDLQNGVLGTVTAGSATITAVGGGWYLCTLTATRATNQINYIFTATGNGTVSYSGNGTSGIYIWGADLRLSADAAVLPTYQPITSSWMATFAGNHMSVSADSKRPTLSARVNLATYTEQFDNAAWTKVNSPTMGSNVAVAPDGTTTADSIQAATSGAFRYLAQSSGTIPVNSTMKGSIYVKKEVSETIYGGLALDFQGGTRKTVYVGVNAVTGVAASLTGNPITPTLSVTDAGSYWLVSATATDNGGNTSCSFLYYGNLTTNMAAVDGSTSAGSARVIWGADVRRSCDAIAGIPAYQRVVDALTYDTTGFPLFALFDGADDAGQTPSIDFSGTDKMTVFAGVTKLSDAAAGTVAELSATIASNNGTFLLSAPNSAAANLNWSSKGTSQVDNTVTTYTAPTSRVIAAMGDISAPSNIIRVNGAQVGSVATSQGSGNYGNFVLNIGMRNNASVPFNGRLYHLVVVGRACSAGEISAAESAINAKMGRVY